MLLILIKSPITINKLLPIWAKFLYTFLYSSREIESWCEPAKAAEISVDYFFVWFKESIRDLFSKRFPSELANSSNNFLS